ncbi:uncharacterized protein LOC129590532 isoform X2 [Paramacrobiotus metropolitanus]|nr:uncharacterized protein LOC129590532 isoform X2 [Paramacrobiotus metropolitanus]
MTIHDGRPWLIEKAPPRRFEPQPAPPPPVGCEPQPMEPRSLASTYNLPIIIHTPETAALFVMQRNKRHIINGLRTLFLFAEQSLHMQLRIAVIPDMVRRLVQIIRYRGGVPQRLALMLLASLSEVRVTARLFRQHGGFEPIRDVFRNPDSDHCMWLSLLVRNVSQRRFYQEQFIRLDAVETLLDWVSKINQHPDVVKHTLQTLYFLCWNARIRWYLVVKGGFTAIVDLVNSRYSYIQYLTFVLIDKLLKTDAGLPIYRFDQTEGVSLITEYLLNINNKKLFSYAIHILEFVRQAPAITKKLQETSFFRVVMDAAVDPSYLTAEDLQEYALKLLCHAAKDEDERRVMHSLGYEEHIVSFLKSCSTNVRIAALKAVAVMCRRPTNQETLYALGADQVIVKIMRCGHRGLTEWGFLATAFLMFRNKVVIGSLLGQGLVDLLQQCLEDEFTDYETKSNALMCALLLRKRWEVLRRLRASVSALIPLWLRHANARMRQYAATALSIFVTDEEARNVFREHGGYSALAEAAVLDQEMGFLRTVCFGLAGLVVDEKTLWEMLNADSFQALFLLKNHLDRISQGFAGFLVHRIIKLGAFFKFAFLGHLDDTDRLPHGLHNQGTISLTNPLRPIEYHLRRGLTADRPVVYIALPKKYHRRPQFAVCYMRDDHSCSMPTATDDIPVDLPVGLSRLEDAVPLQDLAPETVYNPDVPGDERLKGWMRSARKVCQEVQGDAEKMDYLAKVVVNALGGVVERGSVYEEDVELRLAFTKQRVGSDCVPLGMVEKGNGMHRAMLFKVLADVCDLKVTLHRGERGKGWNEVRRRINGQEEIFIVDLLYSFGLLLPKDSQMGREYISNPSNLPVPDRNGLSFKIATEQPIQDVVRLARQRLLQSLVTPRYDRSDPQNTPQPSADPGRKLKLFMNIQQEGTDAASSTFHIRRNILRKVNEFIKSLTVREPVSKVPPREVAESILNVDAAQSDAKEVSVPTTKERSKKGNKN